MNNAKFKKILNITVNVVLILFLIACVLAVAVTILGSRDVDGAVNVFNHKMMIVTSGSMEKSEHTDVSEYDIKSIPVRSMVFVENVPEDAADAYKWYKELKVGDVLTFKYVENNKQIIITHRIISIEENGMGGFVIELQGDNKNAPNGAQVQRIDTSINNSNYVIGKVVGKAVVFGNIITLLKSPLGIVLLIIIPCFIIIGYEAFKIWKVVQEDKKNKANETISEKEREIEELKKKLAAMSEKTEAVEADASTVAEKSDETVSDEEENTPEAEVKALETDVAASEPETADESNEEIIKDSEVDEN